MQWTATKTELKSIPQRIGDKLKRKPFFTYFLSEVLFSLYECVVLWVKPVSTSMPLAPPQSHIKVKTSSEEVKANLPCACL